MLCLVFRMFKNVEDAVEFLFTIPDKEQATAIDIALEHRGDDAESDGDGPSEDLVDVGVENIRLLGVKLLAKPPNFEYNNRNSRDKPCNSWSLIIG